MEETLYRSWLVRLQDESKYVEEVRRLRQERLLHPFVEHRLQALVRKIPSAAHLHAQPEKNGISNGRIDLAIYGEGRTIVHCELIASESGGHVFRDTTSLLGSDADACLAILIDEDVDKKVATDYFRAIPRATVPHVFLRTLVLDKHEQSAISTIEERIAFAAYVNGSIDPAGFRCMPQPSEIKPGATVTITYSNLRAPTMLCVRLMSDSDDPLVLERREFRESSGTFADCPRLPRRPSTNSTTSRSGQP